MQGTADVLGYGPRQSPGRRMLREVSRDCFLRATAGAGCEEERGFGSRRRATRLLTRRFLPPAFVRHPPGARRKLVPRER